jgi:cellulose synthase/poly-beta-1,6-N-acetylglucosamine synthase-like glycosyltransferase
MAAGTGVLGTIAGTVVIATAAWWAYAYAGYPALLALAARRHRRVVLHDPDTWPTITICLTAHNEEATIGDTIQRLLDIDYPAGLREIVVFSDASTDGTDAAVARFANAGVVLRRANARVGKTEGENLVAPILRGEIIINTDATVVVDRNAVKALVRALQDPGVGVASGRDVSVASLDAADVAAAAAAATGSESAYVGYEMMVRDMETRLPLGGLVGASGCLYAARRAIQRTYLPGELSRDFAAALIARNMGLRAVAVPDALCYVPRSTSLEREFRRKTRTITRGLATILRFRRMLNPLRHGTFAWMLWSHKMARWIAPALAVISIVALPAVAFNSVLARVALMGLAVFALCAMLGVTSVFEGRRGLLSKFCTACAFFAAANAAVLAAWARLIRGNNPPAWEPTRRAYNDAQAA